MKKLSAFSEDVKERLRHFVASINKNSARGISTTWSDVLVALKRQGLGYAVGKTSQGRDAAVIYDLKDPSKRVPAVDIDTSLSNHALERSTGAKLEEALPGEYEAGREAVRSTINLGGQTMRHLNPEREYDPDARQVFVPVNPRPDRRPTASAAPPIEQRPMDRVHDGGDNVVIIPRDLRQLAPATPTSSTVRSQPTQQPTQGTKQTAEAERRLVTTTAALTSAANADKSQKLLGAMSPESRRAQSPEQKAMVAAQAERNLASFKSINMFPSSLAQLPTEMRERKLSEAKAHLDSLPESQWDSKALRVARIINEWENPKAPVPTHTPEPAHTSSYGM